MSGEVFANGREIAGKATGNKSIAAMPDVCMSPPAPPTGPIPIPYPNFSEAAKTAKGSKSVKIRGKPAGLKDRSNYKKSKGNEAATRNFGMGVVTHNLQGSTQHSSWSMDIKIEGYNVLRQLDMTTHNHGSPQFNLAVTSSVAKFVPATADDGKCSNLKKREKEARESNDGPSQARMRQTTHTTGHYTAPAKPGAPRGHRPMYNMIACSKQVNFVKFPWYAVGVGLSKTLTYVRQILVSKVLPGDIVKGRWQRITKDGRAKRVREVLREYPSENPSNICGGYKHKSPNNCGKSTHTEARMVEEIFKRLSQRKGPPGSLGTLRMYVHWDQGDGNVSDKACRHCKDMMCAAEACGLKIELCQGRPPKPEPGCKRPK